MKNYFRSGFLAMIFVALSNFSLNAQCTIWADSVNVHCDFNDTPLDPTDDSFLFDVWILGDTGNGAGWIASDGTTGAYDTVVIFGPYPVADGDVSLTLTDVEFPDCSTTLNVTAPNCIFNCELNINVFSITCDDGGTSNDLTDDAFIADIVVFGSNVGDLGWTTDIGVSGQYNQLVSFGPFPVADGAFDIIFTDAEFDTCPETLTLTPPDCVENCTINISVGETECDDNGTPQIPWDDTFTFDVQVDGSFTTSAEWYASDPNNTTGTFGEAQTFGPYNISDGWLSFSIRDLGNSECFDSIWISPPLPCSDGYIDLELSKSISDPTAGAGETVTFNLVVWNWGPAEATGIEVTDYLPDGYESVSNISNGGEQIGNEIIWTAMEILAGDSVLFLSFDAVVAADGDYLNTAEITAADQFDPDSTPGNGVDTDGDGECANDLDDEDDGACAGIVDCNESGLVVDAGPDVTLGCLNENAITLTAFTAGGMGPYTHYWEDENDNIIESGPYLTTNTPGEYRLEAIDMNGCTARDTVIVHSGVQVIADAGPDQTINCLVSVVTLDGSGSSMGTEYSYSWFGPNNFISDALIIDVNVPGWYILTVTNESEPNCSTQDWVFVSEEITTPELQFYVFECGSAYVYDVFSDSSLVVERLWTFPDGSTSTDFDIIATETGYYYLEMFSTASGCNGIDSIYLDLDPENCITLNGHVFWDTAQNCMADPDETGLAGWMVRFSDGQNIYYKVTDGEGNYEISLSPGTYAVAVLPPGNVWYPCEEEYTVVLDVPGSITTLNMPIQKAEDCPVMTVDISAFWLRSCRNNTYWVDYCNEGTATAEDAYVTVQIDPSLSYTSSSIPLASQVGGLLTFELGDVEPNECEYFTIELFIDCDAELGQIHCAEAHVYPDSLCLPPPTVWSGASIQVGADCDGEEVNFTIENVGQGDMDEPANFIVIEDGVMMIVAPGEVQLNSMNDFNFSLPANGATYRLEAEQVANHPGSSMPSVSVEGCGLNEDGTFSTGFVNLFPMDDEDAFVDVECRENNGPYDPNDKTGFPLGFGEEHYIHANEGLEYLIRFQNVGTDTAFNVVIRDTITSFLDIETLRPGVSSHDYTWDIDKGNAVVFTFENIMLPDSNVNVEGSQGFIKFNIAQVRDLPLETVIENNAAIYFDFNDPVITNTTFHTIGEDFLEVVNFVAGPNIAPDILQVFPNPMKNVATFQLQDWQGNQVNIQLFDVHGRLILNDRFNGNSYELNRRHLASGLYLFRLESEGTLIGSGKLMMD